jgi:hypothetical protein
MKKMNKNANRQFTTFNRRDIGKLNKILSKGWVPGVAYSPGQQAQFNISMDNDFVMPSGEIFKQQHLEARFNSKNCQPISESTLGVLYTWETVRFSQATKEESSPALMNWTFAEGLQFDYFKVFPGNLFTEQEIDRESTFGMEMGHWYDSLVNTRTVDLLYMLTFDVVTFEEMNSSLWHYAGQMRQLGDTVDIDALSNSRMHLNFKGCLFERSFFKNGRLQTRFLGLTNIGEQVGVIYEFRSRGSLNVEADGTHGSASQKGESFFIGKLIVDMEHGNLLFADMIELLTVMIKNKKDKLIPLQKRRLVQMTRQIKK